MAIQADDDRLVVAGMATDAGKYNFGLARLNTDGTVDGGFNGGQVITSMGAGTYEGINAVTVQSGGKIVAAGFAGNAGNTERYFAVARYTTAGALDTTFNTTGKVVTDVDGLLHTTSHDATAHGVVVQPDGKIVVAGYTYNFGHPELVLVRYTTAGALDTSFNAAGAVPGILAVRVGPLGTFSFNNAAGYALVRQADGKLLVAGHAQTLTVPAEDHFLLVRVATDGTLDTTFGTGGVVSTALDAPYSAANALALQADGKPVLAGWAGAGGATTGSFALARYTTDGVLDTTFANDGTFITAVGAAPSRAYGVGIQADGKIVAAGAGVGSAPDKDFALVRIFP